MSRCSTTRRGLRSTSDTTARASTLVARAGAARRWADLARAPYAGAASHRTAPRDFADVGARRGVLRPGSYLGVPIHAGEATTGVLSVQTTVDTARYDEADAHSWRRSQPTSAPRFRTPACSATCRRRGSRPTPRTRRRRLPRVDEPRDPDADERDHRHERPARSVRSSTREQQESAEIIRASSEALLTIINDILDFSKVEAGRVELESAAVRLPGLRRRRARAHHLDRVQQGARARDRDRRQRPARRSSATALASGRSCSTCSPTR